MNILIAFTLTAGPILMIYGWGMWDLYRLFTIICMLAWLVKYKKNPISIPKSFVPFFLVFIVSSIIWNGLTGIPLGILMSMLFILFYAKSVDVNSLIKVYRWVAIINVVILFIQNIGIADISGAINFLPLSDSYYEDTSSMEVARLYGSRKSALFAEPAHFAQFLLPLICIESFYNNDKHHNKFLLLFVIALFFLQSGNGFIGLLIFSCFYLVKILGTAKRKYFVMLFPFIILIVITGFSVFMSSSLGISILERTSELSNNQDELTSGFVRIWQGYAIFNDFDMLNKIFGASKLIISSLSSNSIIAGQSFMYFNTVQYFLIYTGLFGLSVFAYFLAKVFVMTTFTGKCIIFIFVVLSFMSSMYFSFLMALYVVIPFSMTLNKNKINENPLCNECSLGVD